MRTEFPRPVPAPAGATGAERPVRKPNVFGVIVRVVIVTGAIAGLGFALGGLLGIIVLATMNATGAAQNMSAALYAYAIPGAVIGGIAGCAAIVWSERKVRQGLSR